MVGTTPSMAPGTPLLLPLAALLASALPAQTGATLLHKHPGSVAGDEFGRSLAVIGDLDGDGVGDYAIGAPRADAYGRSNAGTVELRSGADGSLLRTHVGGSSHDWLGASLAGPGDLDGDGVPDLVAGASNASGHSGAVLAWSSADGSLLWRIDGAQPLDRFGDTLAAVSDFDGDGVRDLLASAPGADSGGLQNVGEVSLLSGANGAVIRSWTGSGDGDKLGSALAEVGDFDADGWPDFGLGAPFADHLRPNMGTVEVRSGATGALITSFTGPSEEARFGHALAGLGDLDDDGVPELLVGAPNAGLAPGVALVLSGATGAVRFQFTEGNGNAYGQRVESVGDLDQDGRGDFLIGVPYWDDPVALLASCGRAGLFSGADGRRLWNFRGSGNGDCLGAGDLDGDGRAELLVGSPFADPGAASHAGRVTVWRFDHQPILTASAGSVSLSAGGVVDLDLRFPPTEAGEHYALLGSRSGAGPTWFKDHYLPLSFDPLFWDTVRGQFPSQLDRPAGKLDQLARAHATLTVPSNAPAWYAGSHLWLLAVSYDGDYGLRFVSRAVQIDLLN